MFSARTWTSQSLMSSSSHQRPSCLLDTPICHVKDSFTLPSPAYRSSLSVCILRLTCVLGITARWGFANRVAKPDPANSTQQLLYHTSHPTSPVLSICLQHRLNHSTPDPSYSAQEHPTPAIPASPVLSICLQLGFYILAGHEHCTVCICKLSEEAKHAVGGLQEVELGVGGLPTGQPRQELGTITGHKLRR